MDLAIWWLSQEACEALDESSLLDQLPEYLRAEFDARMGRPGRGRLWIPRGITFDGIPDFDALPMATAAARCGGIVCHRSDAALLSYWPGFVTNTRLSILGTD